MTRPFVHSYSAGKMFDQCPHKFHQDRVLRRFPFVQSEEAKEGDRQHKVLEEYIRDRVPMPAGYKFLKILGDAVLAREGNKLVEEKWGLRKDFTACGYFDRDVYYRYRNDVAVVHGPYAIMIDWKSGKDKYPDTEQLAEGAVVLMQHNLKVQRVTSGLVFTKTGAFIPAEYTRADLPDMLDQMVAKYAAIDAALAAGRFPKVQGPLCAWCPVTECEFWKPRPVKK